MSAIGIMVFAAPILAVVVAISVAAVALWLNDRTQHDKVRPIPGE